MKKIFLSLSILLAAAFTTGVNAQHATSTLLQGQWIVEKMTVNKTIDDSTTMNIYTPKEVPNSHYVRCPEQITFVADKVIFDYAEIERTGIYTIEGDNLKVMMPESPFDYIYTLNGNNSLQLNFQINYIIDRINKVNEICIFYLTRK